jgi:hypothetical protein
MIWIIIQNYVQGYLKKEITLFFFGPSILDAPVWNNPLNTYADNPCTTLPKIVISYDLDAGGGILSFTTDLLTPSHQTCLNFYQNIDLSEW